MSIPNPRLNATLLQKTDRLKRKEDISLSLLAEQREREQEGQKTYTHKQAWGLAE